VTAETDKFKIIYNFIYIYVSADAGLLPQYTVQFNSLRLIAYSNQLPIYNKIIHCQFETKTKTNEAKASLWMPSARRNNSLKCLTLKRP